MEATKFIWMNGDMVPWDEARIHVLSHALHYGTGVFEGIRAYQTTMGVGIFRLTDHMERLRFSARAYGIALEHSVDQLAKAARELIAANEMEDGYLRPVAHLGLGSVGLNPTGAATNVFSAAWRWGAYLGEEGVRNGIKARVSSWRRIERSMMVPAAKGTGSYLNSVLAKSEALQSGADEALLLNAQGHVAEGSGENVFIVRGGALFTPPPGDGILNGFTRQTVMTLLRDQGFGVHEVSQTRGDLYGADEVFLTGTAAEVTPVREIDSRPVGEGSPGPITRLAQELFAKAVRGELDAYRGWVEPV